MYGSQSTQAVNVIHFVSYFGVFQMAAILHVFCLLFLGFVKVESPNKYITSHKSCSYAIFCLMKLNLC